MSKLAHPNRPHNVPKYPGPPPRKAPEPPKYLLTTEDGDQNEGRGANQHLVMLRGAPTRPKGVSDDPVLSRLSTTTTSRDFISPPDHFPKRVPYRLPSPSSQPKRTRGRDSSRDTKPVPHRSSIMVEEGNKPYGTPLPPSSLPTTGVPKLPAIPRPFVPRPRSEYAHLPLMHQRGPDGKMLGGATRRYVPAEYVPYREPAAETEVQHQQGYAHAQEAEAGTGEYGEYALQEYVAGEDMQQVALVDDSPVGPDNPMKTLSATWSACWDDEAGAVYYYNHTSGEATWVLPDDLE